MAPKSAPMSDARTERERRQAEALKANLRRRKAQARAQDAAQRPAPPAKPPADAPDSGG